MSPSPSSPVQPALPLARLLGHTADAVQAVRAGESLTVALARCPDAARPGTQALAFRVLRRLGSALAARAMLAPKAPPPAVDALLLSALALLWPVHGAPYADHTVVDQTVAAMRSRAAQSAAFANAVLRRFLRERDAVVAALAADPVASYNHPLWWIERLRRDWPDDWERILAAGNLHPPMTLRVNARRATATAYVARLREQGIGARAIALPGFGDSSAGGAKGESRRRENARPEGHEANDPEGERGSIEDASFDRHAVQLEHPCPVDRLPGFVDGDVSVQDAAAQLAAPLLAAKLRPGARVLDACAAPGGKTAHLLEFGDHDLLALDRDAVRLAQVDATLRRLGLEATTRAADAADPGAWWDGRPFEAILLDAPCSASGIVRRHPDARWLRRASDIDALCAVQARLLHALWPLLAPGGRLLYCTCSVFKAEGQEQIDAFLQREPGARLTSAPPSPGHLLALADNPGVAPEAGFSTEPDGFFYALIEKFRT